MISSSLIQFFMLISILALFAVDRAESGDGVSFVEQEDTNPDRKPTSHDRKPIESPRCKAGEWLYPGDNDKDWACDCKPTYLYHPKTSTCFEAYRKGPCANGQYLVLPKSKVVPECAKNECSDGKVKFDGACIKINADRCHKTIKDLKLSVNPRTLQLECSYIIIRGGFEDEEDNYCLLGGMRAQSGSCTPEV